VSPPSNSSETKLSTHHPTKLTTDSRSAQQWHRQANVAKLTPLLIDDGMYADDPLKVGSYQTEVHQIFKRYSQIIASEPCEIAIAIFQSVSECQGVE